MRSKRGGVRGGARGGQPVLNVTDDSDEHFVAVTDAVVTDADEGHDNFTRIIDGKDIIGQPAVLAATQNVARISRRSKRFNRRAELQKEEDNKKYHAIMMMNKKKRDEETSSVYKRLYDKETVEQQKRTNFKNTYLSEGASSSSYLDQVKDEVPLRDLKQVVDSSSVDQNCLFAAVVVEIQNKLQKEYDNHRYCLEVWSTGTMLWQRPLMQKPRRVASSRFKNSIIFLLNKQDEDENAATDVIHILSLNEACDLVDDELDNRGELASIITEIKIPDWTGLCSDPDLELMFSLDHNNTLIVTAPNVLHAARLDNLESIKGSVAINDEFHTTKQGLCRFGINTRKGVQKFDKPGESMRCLRLYETIASNKRDDGQSCLAIFDDEGDLDFNRIRTCDDPENEHKLLIKLERLVEGRKASRPADEIEPTIYDRLINKVQGGQSQVKQLNHVMLKGSNEVTLVLLKNGNADLYWNCRKISSTTDHENEIKFEYTSAMINFDSLIMWRRCNEMGMGLHQVILSLEQQQRTSFEDLSIVEDKGEGAKTFFLNQKYKQFYNPYQEIFLYDKIMLVAHGNMLSQYKMNDGEMNNGKWIAHHKFTNEDTCQEDSTFCSQQKQKIVLRMFAYEDKDYKFSIGILFQDGTFQRIVFFENEQGDTDYTLKQVDGQITGRICSVANDREHARCLYVVSVEDDSPATLWGFSQGILKKLPNGRVTTKSKIIPYFSPADNTQIVVMEPDLNYFRIWEHRQIETELDQPCDFDLKQVKRIVSDGLSERIDCNTLHSIVATKGDELIILFDNTKMHVCDMRGSKPVQSIIGWPVTNIMTHENVNVRGLHLLQDKHLYVMYSDRQLKESGVDMSQLTAEERAKVAAMPSSSGLGYMELSPLLDSIEKMPQLIPITSAICGVNSEIMFSEQNQNLVFMQGFNQILILPQLHLNMLPFKGMRPKDQYLWSYQHKDKFVALERESDEQVTWSIETGKQVGKAPFRISACVEPCHSASNENFNIYRSLGETAENRQSIYDQGVLPYTVIYFKEKVVEMTDKKFYGDRISRNKLKEHQVSHLERQNKEYVTFVVIGLDEEAKMQVKRHFTYPRLLDQQQHLFFSDDFTRLMDIQNDEATVFKIRQTVGGDGMTYVAEYDYRVRSLPFGSYDRDVYQLHSLFSPDFTKHIDVDPASRQWIVRESRSGKPFFQIPRTFLDYNPREAKSIAEQTRFMAWDNNRHISMVDVMAEPLIHEIIEIPESALAVEKDSYEICAGTLPYLEESRQHYRKSYKTTGPDPEERDLGVFNYFKARLVIPVEDVRRRLMRMHNTLKRCWYLRQDEEAIDKQVELKKDERFENIYEELFKVDYISDAERFWVEMPFTFIMWRQIELLQQLCQSSSLQAYTQALKTPFVKETAQIMCLNVLPDCQTVLHLITRNFEFLEYFINITKNEEGEDPFIVPFIQNINGKTALHNSIDVQVGNTRSTEYYLTKFLPEMPFDHHGRAISDCIPDLIQKELPCVGPYLDMRLMPTKQLRKVSRQDKMTIKQNPGYSTDVAQFVSAVDMWPDSKLLISRTLKDSKTTGQQIDIKMFDIPNLHIPYHKVAKELAKVLAEVESTAIFQHQSIHSILSFKWELSTNYITRSQLVPYAVFFIAFHIYAMAILPLDRSYTANYVNEETDPSVAFKVIDGCFFLILSCFSMFFLWSEIIQMKNKGWSYFKSVFNYADFGPPIGIFCIGILDFYAHKNNTQLLTRLRYTLQALVCFGMWAKIFYFLRIWRTTGFFVNMLTRVMMEIRVFVLLYLLFIMAFAMTFYVMSPAGEGPWYYLNQTWLIGLGGDDMDWWSDWSAPFIMQIFYYVSTLGITIIMLNLLIAIVSEAYEEVMSTKNEANDFERAQLMHEVAELVDEQKTKDLVKVNEFMIVATIASSNQDDVEDEDNVDTADGKAAE